MPSSLDDDERTSTARIVEMYLTLVSQERWDEWIDLWADDGVLEFPYAPPGRRSRYVGKPAILAYMKPLHGRIKVQAVDYSNLFPMLDPTMACLEMGVKGQILGTGAPFHQRYVVLFETQARKLWRYREYWNPLVSMDATGGRDAWTNAFGSPDAEEVT